jgi:hypothetical protein
VSEQEPPVRRIWRRYYGQYEVYEESAVRVLCVCGRHFWSWPGSKAEHCAVCLAAHPEWRPQKGISREH